MKSIKQTLFFFFLMALTAAALTSCGGISLAADVTPPPDYHPTAVIAQAATAVPAGPAFPLIAPNPAQGTALYTEKCAPCHGTSGMGDGPQAQKLANPVAAIGSPAIARAASLTSWYNVVTQGRMDRFMPTFKSGLTDQQRWDVVAYAFTLSESSKVTTEGADLYKQNCTTCHGDQGRGDSNQSTQELTDLSLVSQKTGTDFFQAVTIGVPPAMPGYNSKLALEQRWSLAAYIRSLAFSTAQPALASAQITPTIQNTPAETPAGTVKVSPVLTMGGSFPAGTKCKLVGYDATTSAVDLTGDLQADGACIFQGVEMPINRIFVATVVYNEVEFNSEVIQIAANQTSLDLPVMIFETSTDASPLTVDRMHIFFEFSQANLVQVVEMFIVSNPTNKVIIASAPGQPVIKFDLPKSATNLQFEDQAGLGQRYVQTSNGFGDTQPILPGAGQHQVIFAYEMPFANSLDIDLSIPLPVQAAVVMSPQGTNVKSAQLADAGVRDVQGASYRLFNGSNLAAGSVLKVTLTGQGGASATTSTAAGFLQTTGLLVGGGILGLALIGVGLWLFRARRPVTVPQEIPETPSAEVEYQDADSLIDAIAALDDIYKAGKIPQVAYQQRRSELKDRLKEILGKE